MNNNLLEHLQSRLLRRADRLQKTHWKRFHDGVRLFVEFVSNDDLLASTIRELQHTHDDERTSNEVVDAINSNGWAPASESEEVTTSFAVLKYCAESNHNNIERDIVSGLHDFSSYQEDQQKQTEFFFHTFVSPLHMYLEEQLDQARITLGILRRFKHHSEWFRRNELLAIYEEEKKRRIADDKKRSRGEKRLALCLYEYLHNQGLTFSIEPASASGEADIVESQDSDDRLIADVKIFDPDAKKNKAYIISGFHQVYQYTLDYNRPCGYLVVFKTCQEGLAVSSSEQEQSTTLVRFNGKAIFFVIVDLFAHQKTASQRGKLKSYVITENELVTKQVESEEPQTAPSDDTEESEEEQ